MLTYGSLFTGIGGIDLGFDRAGMVCKWQVEIDDYCSQLLDKRFPDVRRYTDVKKVHGIVQHANAESTKLESQNVIHKPPTSPTNRGVRKEREPFCPSCLEPVDVITGGFPCQPHSVAGKQKGAADDRNLWPEYLRIITELRPTWVIGENVPGIITTYLDTVLSDLESAGYKIATFNLPAVAFDAKHRRERIFVVAYAEGSNAGKPPQW